MTTWRHTCDGWADGETITTGGTGSGDTLTSVSTAAGGSLTGSAAAAVYGTRGGSAAVAGTAAGTWVAFAINAANSAATMHGQISIPVPASLPQRCAVLRGMDAADTGQRWRVSINTSGQVELYNGANTLLSTGATDYRGTSIRIAAAIAGAVSANGTVKIYPATAGSDAAPIETLTATAQNFGGPIRVIRGGIPAASGTNITMPFDDLGASEDGPLGPAQIAPSGITVTIALGGPTLSQTFAITPDGIAVPLSLGAIELAQALAVAPDGIAVPVALGDPVVSQSLVLTPTGIAATLDLGSPAISQALAITPSGIAVPLTLGATAVIGPHLATATLVASTTGATLAASVTAATLTATT